MEYKTDALLLRTTDFGENDKMATLFSADRGKTSVCFKGVKKAGAKLRFAAQPFCFAEYVLAERANRRTVVSASLYDGFYALRERVESFYAAAAVCEVCDKLLYEGMVNGELFLAAVTALKEMCIGEASFPLVKFLLKALELAGWRVRAEDVCPLCRKPLLPSFAVGGFKDENEELPAERSRMRFDMENGLFVCDSCMRGVPASAVTYLTVKLAQSGKTSCGAEGERRALKLLYAYFTRRIETQIASLEEYIRLISSASSSALPR